MDGEPPLLRELTPSTVVMTGKSVMGEGIPHHPVNEDAFFLLPEKSAFGTFDGVGGGKRGDLASKTARDTVKQRFKQEKPKSESLEDAQIFVHETLLAANQAVVEVEKTSLEYKGMTTTGVIGYVWEGPSGEKKLIVESVGDSRAYLLRQGVLKQITADDSFIRGLVDDDEAFMKLQEKFNNVINPETELTDDERFKFERRSILTKALGSPYHAPTGTVVDMEAGDRILFCGDGLSDTLTDSNPQDDTNIQKILIDNPDPDQAVDALINAAKTKSHDPSWGRAKPDDITVIVVDFKEATPALKDVAVTGPQVLILVGDTVNLGEFSGKVISFGPEGIKVEGPYGKRLISPGDIPDLEVTVPGPAKTRSQPPVEAATEQENVRKLQTVRDRLKILMGKSK